MDHQPYAASRRAKRFRPTGLPKSSRRKMSFGRRVWYGLIVTLGRGLLALLWASCRLRPVRGGQHLEQLRESDDAAIICYWHQMQVFCAWYLLTRAEAGLRVSFLTSPSVSGEVPAAIVRRWGAGVLRGSSKRSAGQALKDMYDVLVGQKTSLVITPDGPTGPLHEFKVGTLMLSRMTKRPIIPIAYAASPCVRWNSWDRFMLPLPFARVAIAVGEPFFPPTGTGTEDLPRLGRELQQRLAALGAEAQRAL